MRKETKKKLKNAKEASLPFYTRDIPNNLQTLQKFKVPNFRDISVILTASHRHSSSFFFFLPGKPTLFACYLLSQKRVSIKKKKIVICLQRVFCVLLVFRQSNHSYYLTVKRRSGWIMSTPLRGSFKHSVGTEGSDKAKSRKQMW